ncbi:MAG: hypothetical protein LBG46_07135 [Elusimicrobiota bacterium]|jgi:hypothetical protein|nr:hypothetical protein [Elusimicrobiota bacterium]
MEAASLRIVLSANISEFEKSMHKIERDFANITKKAETFSKVGAVITGAFALAVKSYAAAGDAAAKMSGENRTCR